MTIDTRNVPDTPTREPAPGGARPAPRALTRAQLRSALPGALRKLDPRVLYTSPVMFVVEVGAVVTTVLAIVEPGVFAWWIAVWLWATVLFATLAESVAESRGKAQASTLRATQKQTTARKVDAPQDTLTSGTRLDRLPTVEVPSSTLQVGDVVVVAAGETVPGDGDVIEGVASIDESAVTGESAPVIRESGGDRSAVTGGTVVLSDQVVVRITAPAGATFVDRMIALVEGSERQKTPNEIALNILLTSLTVVFLLAVATLQPFAIYSGARQDLLVLVALLVCLIPTTIGALLSAIGIAGMDRLVQRNVLAMSGRAVEAAGDVDVLLLDKTGTITYGNRRATEVLPVTEVTPRELAESARLASLADETPEGRSIVELVDGTYGTAEELPLDAALVPFTAQTRMSGVDLPLTRSSEAGGAGNTEMHRIRKGAGSAIRRWAQSTGTYLSEAETAELDAHIDAVSRMGGTPWSWGSSSASTRRASSASSGSRTWSRRACASGSTRCAP
nr:hypothetical protein GCM10025730_20960 [Promicromonospora thailandica]